jgi:hypothetical protein
VPAFEAAEAFTPPADPTDAPDLTPEAEGEAPSFAVDAAGEASPLANAEGEAPQAPQPDADGEPHPEA